MAQLEAEDYNKDIKEIRHKLNKVFLKLSTLDSLPIMNHIRAVNRDLDHYMQYMKHYTVIVASDLRLPHSEFAHIGYVAWGDFYDVDGVDLYESKKWSSSIEYYKQGESWWHKFRRGFRKSIYS